jgi:hypothetical protein
MIGIDTNVLARFLVGDDPVSHAYRFTRVEIVGALQQLRRGAQMTIEGADEVRRATEAYAMQRGDFADYLIASDRSRTAARRSPRSTAPCTQMGVLRRRNEFADRAAPRRERTDSAIARAPAKQPAPPAVPATLP